MRHFALFLVLVLLHVPSPAQQPKPVQVVVSSPLGRTRTIDQTQTISVTFNQAMTPLRDVPQDEESGPMLINPPVKGKYRWQGTSTLTFIPTGSLPYATEYSVTIPAGTAAINGEKLASTFQWTFETPRPQLINHEPFDDQHSVELDFAILLRFNQPVDPETAAKSLSLEEHVGNQTAYPAFTTSRPDTSQAKDRMRRMRWQRPGAKDEIQNSLVLSPRAPFKKGATIIVRAKIGLAGVQGPLPSAEEYAFRFTTYNEFKFSRVANADGFNPDQALELVFTNPVYYDDLIHHLRFSPLLELESREYNYAQDHIYLQLPLQPETEYTGFILPGLKDLFGQEIADTVRFKFRTGSYPPSVHMTTGQGVLEAYESHKYPVIFRNIDSVRVELGRVNPDRIVEVMQRLNYGFYERLAWEQAILTWMDRTREDASQFSVSSIWRVQESRNRKTTKPMDLDVVLGTAQRGIVLAQVDNLLKGDARRYLKALVQVTNLGVTAKFSPENNLVWVTNLKDASPVAGATVEIRDDSNKVFWNGVTDENGFAKGPGWFALGMMSNEEHPGSEEEWDYGSRQPRQWVLIRAKDDVAFSCSDWTQGIEPWQFNIVYDWNPKPNPRKGQLFTDRGLYKAGEQVELKGIIRELRGNQWRIPDRALPLRLKVRNSRNEEILSREPAVSPFGSFAVSIPLKLTAPLGYYSVDLSVKKKVQVTRNNRKVEEEKLENISGTSFRVEAFRAAEFDVSARFANPAYIVGDSVNGVIMARYLFGGAMKNALLNWRISANPTSWRPEGFDEYTFGPNYWLTRYRSPASNLLLSDQTTLDDNGAAGMAYTLRVGEIRGTQSLMLEGDVTSPSRQQISGRAGVLVHGAEFTIGIGLSTTFAKVDSLLRYKVAVVDTGGKFVPGASVSLKLYRRIWRSVRKAETGGRYYWTSETEDSLSREETIVSASKPIERTFTPPNAGLYYFDLGSKDRRGNATSTQESFYVSGSGYVAWERSNDDRIELISDKTDYKPGEVAHIIVKSPYEQAPAMISIERGGILQHRRTVLTGSAPQIDIPITSEHLPNIFVSVILLQGRVEGAAITRESDIGRPSFKIGYIGLSVSPQEKMLSVKVETDRKEYRPGDSVWVTLSTKAANGKGTSAEVTLSVADLGILNLTNYRMPNPFHNFYQQRSLAVTTSESRIHLVQQRDYGEKGEDEGGGGAEEAEAGMNAEGIRKDFRPSAYWNPAVITNAEGKARVRFKLPDNLTSFEVMAVAQSKSADFGYGESSFLVNKPLLMQPALPRFARIGDRFEGGVVLTNYTQKEKKVRLITSSTGITMSNRDTLVSDLPPGQSKEARMSFVADRLGMATFTFRASTDEDVDGLEWKIPIQVPRLRESVALFSSTTEPESHEQMVVPKDSYQELGTLETTLASTAMVGLTGGISYLLEYPYGCLEQRLSRVLPLVLAQELVEGFKFEVFKDKDYRAVATSMLDEVPLFQREDGGFAYWKNTPDTWPYLSAFTMYTLVQAEKHGYQVDKSVIDNGIRYLRGVLNNTPPSPWYHDGYWACTRALILYTFALNGTPDFGWMDRLYGDRVRLPLFARAYLLKAYSASKGNRSVIEDLARDLTNNAKVAPTSAHFEDRERDDDMWMLHSTTRTTALVLQTLVETQPENSIIPKVVRWLVDQQKIGCWRTTQENLYVVDALATYFKTYEREEPNFNAEALLAGGTMLKESFTGRSLKTAFRAFAMSELTLGAKYALDFRKDGPGRLYYTVRMNYYPKSQTVAKEEGLAVSKSVAGLTVAADAPSSIKAGTVAKVTLTISTNQDRTFVVVDDPVPAGFEIINTSFQTAAAAEGEQEQGTGEWWRYNPFRHRERYDDRALFFADYLPAGVYSVSYLIRVTSFGTYQMPATRVEGMYEPEVFGQTSSGMIRVE